MSRAPELTTINCTSCGAGLDVLGGGRVAAHICGYCGAELDAQHDYQVLARFDGLERPDSPFRIGMTGTLFGVQYTVIGTLEHRERWGAQVWTWIDHQLFSPTHGYAWITVEEGHLVFTRRYRRPVWMSVARVETSEHRPSVSSRGQRYNYYETSTSEITFAEGEFTWAPRIGDRTTTVSALGTDAMLGFSETGTEREVYRSTYLPRAEAEAGFGIDTGLRPQGIHPLQSYKAGRHDRFLRNTCLALALVTALIGLIIGGRDGTTFLPEQRFAANALPQTVTFDVTDATGLTDIRLQGDVRNSWAYLTVELEDPEGEPLFEAGRTVEYYFGRDSDGNWSEGRRWSTLRFHPETTGTYTMNLGLEEQGHWPNTSAGGAALSQVTVSVAGGRSSGFWLYLLAGIFALGGGSFLARRFWHHTRRWRGSDWTDED